MRHVLEKLLGGYSVELLLFGKQKFPKLVRRDGEGSLGRRTETQRLNSSKQRPGMDAHQ